jgi:hypothetical protein
MEKKSKDDRKSIEPHEWFWSILGMVVFVALGVYTLMSASASG